ncbi:MAG: DUF302 domain-containing protein [Gammaproteobacteria bacterium]|nr:DUF302 domain-containing protein [Gammaproteobacteria bacterium]MBL7000719.1 DUF302 domain-containing protein [Gammaproteobacteria bacterium]
MKKYPGLFLLSLMLCWSPAQAENMIMLRVSHSFDNTMILIKEKLDDYGYKVAHIQKCDTGLSDSGYKTDFYKSIFFGKFEEMRHLTATYPELIPYLPIKIAIMQEKETVLIVAMNPETLSPLFPSEELAVQFARWESDLRAIFEEVSETQKLEPLNPVTFPTTINQH